MKRKTYTYQELVDFIKSQKDTRLIDNNAVIDVDGVAGVLVHFGRNKLRKPITEVGFCSIKDAKYFLGPTFEEADKAMELLITCENKKITNYGQLKKKLKLA